MPFKSLLQSSVSACLISAFVIVSAAGAQPTPATHVTGTVRDAGGKPISGARVSISARSGESHSAERITAITGKNGSFDLVVNAEKNKPFLVKEVWAEKSGCVRSEDRQPRELKAG